MLHFLQQRLEKLRLLGKRRLLTCHTHTLQMNIQMDGSVCVCERVMRGTHECNEFVLQLIVQPCYHHLYSVPDLSHALVLRPSHRLHILLLIHTHTRQLYTNTQVNLFLSVKQNTNLSF